jgi:hypothetical protein
VQYDFEPFSFGALSARVDVAYKDEFVFHPFRTSTTPPMTARWSTDASA